MLITITFLSGTLALPALAQSSDPSDRLVRKVTKQCHLRAGVLTADKGEIHFAPSPDDNFKQIDCALARLKGKTEKFGFVGNELDPNAVLTEPYRYIAMGTTKQVTDLESAVRQERWLVISSAQMTNGEKVLSFKTREGETAGGAQKLMDRIWAKEFGDLSFGMAPRRLSASADDQ